jgi:polysaccharide export outer membrane protein
VKASRKKGRFLTTSKALYLAFGFVLIIAGCGGPQASNYLQIERFNMAGDAVQAELLDPVMAQKINAGLYKIAPGDVLEFTMPTILSAKSADLSDLVRKVEPFISRVSNTGTVTLPIIGEVTASGKTLAQIEQDVIEAYYPEYVVKRPTIVCKISEHVSKKQFAVIGLVNKPGVFEYPSESRYSVLEALAFAGGANIVADPEYATVYRKDLNGNVASVTVKIDRKSMAQTSQVIIRPGDVVAVEITARERANMILAQVFYIRAGADVDLY